MARILLVDDSITSRKILRNIIEEAGHTIIGEAVNGEEGAIKYKELQPDITTMDITMPILDGIDSLKLIMEDDPAAKVIMVTAAGQKNRIVDALKYGASEFIAKPFESNQIINVINQLID